MGADNTFSFLFQHRGRQYDCVLSIFIRTILVWHSKILPFNGVEAINLLGRQSLHRDVKRDSIAKVAGACRALKVFGVEPNMAHLVHTSTYFMEGVERGTVKLRTPPMYSNPRSPFAPLGGRST